MKRKNNKAPLCFICQNDLQERWSTIPVPEKMDTFSIFHCRQCNLEQTWPQPKNMSPYYSDYYGSRHGFTARYCAQRRLSWVKQWSHHPGKLLDVGCGEGTFLLAAARAGWEVSGVDINPKLAQKQGLKVYSQLSDIQDSTSFDCITLWHSLEHMHEPQEILKKIKKILAPNGLLIIAVPNAKGWQAKLFGKYWLHRDIPRHLYHFGSQSLLRLLHSYEFEIVKSRHQEFEYDLLGWSQSLLNCLSNNQNVFFKLLTGKQSFSTKTKILNLIGGIFFSALALPLIPISSLAKSGGTLIVASRLTRD